MEWIKFRDRRGGNKLARMVLEKCISKRIPSLQHFRIPPNEALKLNTCYNAQGEEVPRRNTNPDYSNSIFNINLFERDPEREIYLHEFLRHHEKFGDAAKDVVFCTGNNNIYEEE